MRIITSSILIGLLFATPACATDAARTTSATLACGHAHLRAETTSIAHVPPTDALTWVSQRITLISAGKAARPLQLQDLVKASASTGLPAIVSSWQCLRGAQDSVIELWLTCNRADLGGVCGGEREWERLVDMGGRPLDTGYAPQDPRYEALSKRLGITVDGVQLRDALGE